VNVKVQKIQIITFIAAKFQQTRPMSQTQRLTLGLKIM